MKKIFALILALISSYSAVAMEARMKKPRRTTRTRQSGEKPIKVKIKLPRHRVADANIAQLVSQINKYECDDLDDGDKDSLHSILGQLVEQIVSAPVTIKMVGHIINAIKTLSKETQRNLVRKLLKHKAGQSVLLLLSDNISYVLPHESPVKSAEFNGSGGITTTSEDGTIKGWSFQKGLEPKLSFTRQAKSNKEALKAYSPDGESEVSVYDRKLKVRLRYKRFAQGTRQKGLIRSLTFDTTGNKILAAHNTGATIWTYNQHQVEVNDSLSVLGLEEEAQSPWQEQVLEHTKKEIGIRCCVYAAFFNRTGDHVVTASQDKTVKIWALSEDGNWYCEATLQNDYPVYDALLINDSNWLVTTHNNALMIWYKNHSGTWNKHTVLRGHTKPIVSVKLNGRLLMSASKDKTARIWNYTRYFEGYKYLFDTSTLEQLLLCIIISRTAANGEKLNFSTCPPEWEEEYFGTLPQVVQAFLLPHVIRKNISTWRVGNSVGLGSWKLPPDVDQYLGGYIWPKGNKDIPFLLHEMAHLVYHHLSLTVLYTFTDISSTGDYLLTVESSKEGTLWVRKATNNWVKAKCFDKNLHPMVSGTFSPKGNVLATRMDSKKAQIWQLADNGTWQFNGELETERKAIKAVHFNNSGCKILTISPYFKRDEYSLEFWIRRNGEWIHEGNPIKHQGDSIRKICFNADSTKLAIFTDSRNIILFLRNQDGQWQQETNLEAGGVWLDSISFSLDGTIIDFNPAGNKGITVSRRPPLTKIWARNQEGQWHCEADFSTRCDIACFNQTGDMLLTVYGSIIKFWKFDRGSATWNYIATLNVPSYTVNSLAFLGPKEDKLFISAQNKKIVGWWDLGKLFALSKFLEQKRTFRQLLLLTCICKEAKVGKQFDFATCRSWEADYEQLPDEIKDALYPHVLRTPDAMDIE